MNERNEFLPIKVIVPHRDDLRKPRPGGGAPIVFTQHLDQSREVMLAGIQSVASHFERAFSLSNLPAVARITLRNEAIAKSHHPAFLFNPNTCPVIGFEDFGQLLVSVRPTTLKRLYSAVTQTGKDLQNDVSKILSIEPFSGVDAIGNWTIDNLRRFLETERSPSIKLRAFDHRDPEVNQQIIAELIALTERLGLPTPRYLNYGGKLKMFKIDLRSPSGPIENLAEFVGTQSLDVFEQFGVSTQATPVHPMQDVDLPEPDPDEDYPVVGIIDSGTDPTNLRLQAWVLSRDESQVPAVDQDNTHGSLVAGLIVNGRAINHDHPGFPSGKAKVVDYVAIPSTGSISEDDLVDVLRSAFMAYPDVRIWNLSVNSGRRCRNDRFSEFGMALDSLQDEFRVMIVNSAGNYNTAPLHNWIRPDLSDDDRICAPADSLRAMTVGSIAHLATNGACAAPDEPSPFTRKGPGAAFVPKPEVSHFGGNSTHTMRYAQMGVLSVDGAGNIAEAIGTSFAAPSIALTAAQLAAALDEQPSRHLLKAFIVHSAILGSEEVTAAELPYKGFGKPPSVEDIIRCQPWEATLVFDLELPYSHRNFHKTDFPFPSCLKRDGKLFGEIIMTLAYDPPVDSGDGAAYSQVNVNASLGMCWTGDDGKMEYDRKVIPYPKNVGDLYEKNQIEHGFKWSPVKVFRHSFKKLVPRDFWRISLEMITRHPTTPPASQKVALIVTIRDPERQQPVYNEVIQMMNRSGWVTQNLQVRESTRIRTAI